MIQKNKLLYTAAVLTKDSRSKLLSYFDSVIPIGWEKIAHHMTIIFGENNEKYKDLIGEDKTLNVEKIGISDMAIAVQVSGCPSEKEIPHITLAINKDKGAKPVMSNDIKKWVNVSFGLELNSQVKEIWK